ncbi:site-specific integrase [Leifsonia sp. TF02-11]|uniref:site-specific integrase n=1 Tax=Leifsonia sp. TF02-11 TaxID=2815212 RepID=UPI001AA12126|nr:site-specific integrase [Leifsonia sp. TF02-11]MBO1740772.1 site-specific integrase [Leifsonia sp. TF02-11]
MGTISPYDTAHGKRYRVRYRTPDHRQTDKRGFKTKRDAELFLASVEISKARGEFVDASESAITIGALGTVWLSNQSHLKPSSKKPLEVSWHKYVQPQWGRLRVRDVRFSEVQNWVTRIGQDRSATVVLRAYGVLAGILDVAVRDRRITSNPARGVNLPRKVARPHVYLTHEQVHRLAAASGQHALLVFLLAYTGLRWGEAIGLRTRDVDLRRRRITVTVNAVEVAGVIEVGTPKTHKRRDVPYPPFLSELMADQIAGKGRDDLVFSDADGQHLRRTRVSTGSRSWFKTALREAELEPMTLHDLRHTAASLAISSGANVKAVQRMLGHASAAMTLDLYADLFDDDLDDVAMRLQAAVSAASVGKMWANASSTN